MVSLQLYTDEHIPPRGWVVKCMANLSMVSLAKNKIKNKNKKRNMKKGTTTATKPRIKSNQIQMELYMLFTKMRCEQRAAREAKLWKRVVMPFRTLGHQCSCRLLSAKYRNAILFYFFFFFQGPFLF